MNQFIVTTEIAAAMWVETLRPLGLSKTKASVSSRVRLVSITPSIISVLWHNVELKIS